MNRPDLPRGGERQLQARAHIQFKAMVLAQTQMKVPSGGNHRGIVGAEGDRWIAQCNTQRREISGEALARFAVEPIPGPLDTYAEYLRKESAMWGEVIRKANVKIE